MQMLESMTDIHLSADGFRQLRMAQRINYVVHHLDLPLQVALRLRVRCPRQLYAMQELPQPIHE